MFLTICMIVTMLPVGALAVETPASTVESASPSSVADPMTLLSLDSVTTVATETDLVNAMSDTGSGDVVALGANLSMSTQLTVARSVTLDLNGYKLEITLEGGNHANCIKLAGGVTFRIQDSSDPSIGKLSVINKATPAPSERQFGAYAGINTTDGTLKIKSGTVEATGGRYGAGIGGGYNENGGTIIISGGTVNAAGISGAAAIGGGSTNNGNVPGGTITITGGTVTAAIADSGTGSGAAIGGG